MIIIDDKLISLDLFDEYFFCAIDKCKGACCIEGDLGAPLEEEEVNTLENILQYIRPYMTMEGIEATDESIAVYYDELNGLGTPLLRNGACAFVRVDDNGIAKCTIEEAYLNGETDFRKPISCHLYPIRIKSNPERDFEAVNYDRWDICHAACNKGKDTGIRVFEFAKDALIRKYGPEFYTALEEAYAHYSKTDRPVFE